MPSLEKLYRDFRQTNFMLLTVDVGEDEQTVKRFIEKNNLSFPVLLDSDNRVASQYGVRGHPAAYLIDNEGNIIGIAQGYREWYREEMQALINSLISAQETRL